ncbi:MAG: putative serine/threonine-protein kinase pknB, partial [Myxococcaceae bacterium]|nr:putative serine/threonine-protein kinase pknB [Myxococcaceae bacterium]
MNQGRVSLIPVEVVGGKYRVVSLLGRGGMGEVYECENTWTRRRVALKLLKPADDEAGADSLRRFAREAQAAAQLQHPNIVDVLDMGQDEALNRPFIVQEFLQGEDLRRALRAGGGRLGVEQCFAVIVPVMEALAFAHARGVIHRDIKPDNIFLAQTPKGVVPKLIDFGIAKVTDHDESMRRTSTGTMLGTPSYMSPEQARGDSALDARSDVWSLGVVLYEMLSGFKPYTAANANVLVAMILRDDPTPLLHVSPSMPPALAAVVMRAVCRDLAQRWPSVQHFHDALLTVARNGWSDQAPPPLSAPPGAAALPDERPATVIQFERSMPESPAAHGSRGFWITLALLIPVAMAGGVWLAKRNEVDRSAPMASVPVTARPPAPPAAVA